MVQQYQTCYNNSPRALPEVRDHLQLVKPDAATAVATTAAAATAAAQFHKLRGPPVARLPTTSAVPCLLCASLLLDTNLLLGSSLFYPLTLLDDFLNTRLVAIPNSSPRTLRQPLFSRASPLSRGCVGGHGTEMHLRLRKQSIKRLKALALFYTTVPRALKRGTTRLMRHSAAESQCPFTRGEEESFAILQN